MNSIESFGEVIFSYKNDSDLDRNPQANNGGSGGQGGCGGSGDSGGNELTNNEEKTRGHA